MKIFGEHSKFLRVRNRKPSKFRLRPAATTMFKNRVIVSIKLESL